MSFAGQFQIGQVFVQTTHHRGFTPEEIAERAAYKVLRVDSKQHLNDVLVRYLKEAQDSERKTLKEKLIQAGYLDAANFLGDL